MLLKIRDIYEKLISSLFSLERKVLNQMLALFCFILYCNVSGKSGSENRLSFDKKIFEFHAVKDKDQLTSKPTNFT